MLMYPPGIVRRSPHSFPECISDFAFAGWIPVIGELQKLLGKGEYEPLRPTPLFESNFLQVTKRGELVDVHNRPVLVTLGIAATSPALLLPDVMIIARPIERPQGELLRPKEAKALVELEMTRLIPLELVSLYLHDMGEQRLKMRLATGRVYYLKLCAPRGEERPLFARWLRLIYLLRTPPDSWASIPSWHTCDLRGRSTRLPPSQRLRPIREEEEPGATTPQPKERPASLTSGQHPSTRSVGEQVSSCITPVKRSHSTTNLSDDPSRFRAEVASPWMQQKPSAERNQGQLSLAIPSGEQGGASSRSQVESWSQRGSCAGSRAAFTPGSPERSRASVGVGRSAVETASMGMGRSAVETASVGVGRSAVETASVGVGRSAVETASVGVGRSLLTTTSAAAGPSRPASPRLSGMGRDTEPGEKSRERSVERSHPSTEQGRSHSQSQRGSTAASVPAGSPDRSRASVPAGSPERSRASVPAGSPERSRASVPAGSPERSRASVPAGSPERSRASMPAGSPERSRASVPASSPDRSRASVPAGSSERSRASMGVGRSAVETASVGVGRSLLTTTSAAVGPSRPASPRFSGMGREMEPGEKSREWSVEQSQAQLGHTSPSTEQGRSRSQSQRGSTAASRASLSAGSPECSRASMPAGSPEGSRASMPAGSSERSRASMGVGRSAVETASVGVGRSLLTMTSAAVGPSRPASPRFSGMGREMEPGEKSREWSVERSQAQLGHTSPSTQQGRSCSQSQHGSTAASRASLSAGSPERSRASMPAGSPKHSRASVLLSTPECSMAVEHSLPFTALAVESPSRLASSQPSGMDGQMESGRTHSRSPHGSRVVPRQSGATMSPSSHTRSGGSRAPSFPVPASCPVAVVSPERSQLSSGAGPSEVAQVMGPSGQRSQGSSPVALPGRQATRSRGPAGESSKFRARFSSSSGSHKGSSGGKGSESKGKLKSVLSSAKNRSSLTFMTLYSALSDSLDKLTGRRLSQRKSQEEAEAQLCTKSSKRVTISGVVEMSTLGTPEISSTAASKRPSAEERLWAGSRATPDQKGSSLPRGQSRGSRATTAPNSPEKSRASVGLGRSAVVTAAAAAAGPSRQASVRPSGTGGEMESSKKSRESSVDRSHGQLGHASPSMERGRSRSRSPTGRPSQMGSSTMPRDSGTSRPSERSRISVAAGPSERSRISVAAGPSERSRISVAAGPSNVASVSLAVGPSELGGDQLSLVGRGTREHSKAESSREKSEKYRASMGGSSPERSKISLLPSSQERSRASVPPDSAERSRVSVPPQSGERSRVSVPPESTGRSRVSVPPESAGRSRVLVSPEYVEKSRVSVHPESSGRSRASMSPESAERSRVSVPPESVERSRVSVPPEYAGRSRASVPPESVERSRVSVPPQSGERSRVSMPPESVERSRVSVPPESTGRSRVSVPPKSAGRSRVSPESGERSRVTVSPEYTEKSRVSVHPESSGRSRASMPPGSAERSRVSVPPESARRSRVSVPPESAEKSRVSVCPESAGRSRALVPPGSAERSRVSVAVGPSELSRTSVAVGPSEMATVSVAVGLSKPGSLSSARTPGAYAPRSPSKGRSRLIPPSSGARLGIEAGDVSLGRCREQSQAREEGGSRSQSPLSQPSLAPNARAASSSQPTELDRQGEGSSRASKAKSRSKHWQEDKQDSSAGHLASRGGSEWAAHRMKS